MISIQNDYKSHKLTAKNKIGKNIVFENINGEK